MEKFTNITDQMIEAAENEDFDGVRAGAIEIHDLLGEITEDWSERHSELWDMTMMLARLNDEDFIEAGVTQVVETIEGAAPKDGE